jgi:hypothetical protein
MEPSASPAASPQPSGPLAIGETTQVQDVTITLQGARIGESILTEPGEQALVAEFTIKNTSNEVKAISTL